MKPYWTIHVPFVSKEMATEWHPTESTGPWAVRSMGAFQSEFEAIHWGKTHLNGCPYSIHEVECVEEEGPNG